MVRYADIADIDLGIGSMDRLLKESISCSFDIGVAEQEATLSQ